MRIESLSHFCHFYNFGWLLLVFFHFFTFDEMLEINLRPKNRLLWHLSTFPTFFPCTSLYKLVQACTSSKKFCAGLLMHCLCPQGLCLPPLPTCSVSACNKQCTVLCQKSVHDLNRDLCVLTHLSIIYIGMWSIVKIKQALSPQTVST